MRAAKRSLSSGPDSIPSIFWAKLSSSLCLPVSIIFSCSYKYSILPNDWKDATVLPLFKKGDPSLPANYRPISLTCTISKVMESMIRDNVMQYAQASNILSPSQHGFLPSRSTSTQLLECMYDWCRASELGCCTDVVYIDFKKAFDSVPHVKLKSKLISYGYCCSTVSWICEFLSNRSQHVRVNQALSDAAGVTSGIVQGSVLGPALFVLYANDLPTVCSNVQVKLYADDVKVYKMISCPADRLCLQEALDAIDKWSREWQLYFSVEKCQFMQLGYSDTNILYRLGTAILTPIANNKDLGITVNSNLKPSLHINNTVHKANARSKLILKCFHSCDPALLTKAFITYVRPLLEYGTSVWNPCYVGDINRLESVQRSFTYKVLLKCNIPYNNNMRYDDRLDFLRLERLELRRLRTDLTELFKIVKGFSSQYLFNILPFSHNSNTRGHRYKLSKVFIKKDILKHYFIFRCINAWNVLPDAYFNTNVIESFKRKLLTTDFSTFLLGTL